MTAIPTAGTAEAQVRSQSGSLRVPSPGPLPAQFREMDRNNDGVISREEWRDTLQSFRANDRNRDNVLSGDELRMSISPNGRFEEADDEPEGSDEIDEWTAEAFANLDRDRDTRISRTEWPYALATFRRVDRNRDNVISRTEFLGTAATNGDRRDRFVTLDTDNNGRIERDEWRDSDDAFDWLDRNADGVLSRSEVVGDTSTTTTPTDTTPVGAFASLDNNQNGVITRDEWSGSRASFNQLDANRDGVLSRREFRTTDAPASTPAGTGTRVVRVDAMQQWIDSGIFVRAGDLVTFDADGTVRMSPDPNDAATPAGSLTGRHAPNAPVRTALAGALVMRIGDGPVQYAGARGSFTALSSGQLHLGVNDDHMADNSGEFRVTVTVRPR